MNTTSAQTKVLSQAACLPTSSTSHPQTRAVCRLQGRHLDLECGEKVVRAILAHTLEESYLSNEGDDERTDQL